MANNMGITMSARQCFRTRSCGVIVLSAVLLLVLAKTANCEQKPLRVIAKSSWAGRIAHAMSQGTLIRDQYGVVVEPDLVHLKRFISGKCPVLVWTHCPMDIDLGPWLYGFKRKVLEATKYEIGQAKVAVIANRRNSVAGLSLLQVRKILSQKGKNSTWRDIGGRSTAKVNCYVEPLTSQSVAIARQSCMQYGKKVRGGVVQCFLPFRDDLVKCQDFDDIVKKVAKDANGIGFVMVSEKPLLGVKVLAIAIKDGGPSIKPLAAVIQEDYPVSERLVLYIHPDKPATAVQFAELCIGEEGAKIAAKHGLITPWHQKQAEGLARLKEMKAGKGVRIGAIGVKSGLGLVKELAIDYVKAKAVIQMRYTPMNNVSAVGYFVAGRKTGGMELLLLNGKPSRRAMKIHGKKWEALWKSSGGKPTEHVIAGRGVAIVVHSLNKLDSLTLEQVRAVFAGKVKDWKVLAGGTGETPVLQIHRFGLKPSDPAAEIFHEKVLDSRQCGSIKRKKDTAAVLAALSIDPQGIAFVDAVNLPADLDKSSIKVLAIGPAGEAIAPTTALILDGSYLLSRRLHLYVSPKAGDVTRDFVKFVLSGVCGETFGKNGLVVPMVKPVAPKAIKKK